MDAYRRGSGFGFPAYDGCFPKAMRSSRGRGHNHKKSKDCPKDMSFFELLATVAGQLLQDQEEAGLTVNHKTEPQPAKSSEGSAVERGGTCNEDAYGYSVTPSQRRKACTKGMGEAISMELETTSKVRTMGEESEPDHYMVETSPLKNQTIHLLTEATPRASYSATAELYNSGKCGQNKLQDIINSELNHLPKIKQEDEGIDNTMIAGCDEINLLMLNDKGPPVTTSESSGQAATPEISVIRATDDPSRNQNKSGPEGRDDDGDSSESAVLRTKPSISTRVSRAKASNTRGTKRTGFKRKHQELEGGTKETMYRQKQVPKSQRKVKATTLPRRNIDHVSNPLLDNEKDEKPSSKRQKVTLSVKSFTVPELHVDLPESATVANLKRAVMEAAMNLLGGGLCMRVIRQGKKILDESTSLLEAGISSGESSDSLNFMLEPSPLPASTSGEESFFVLSNATGPAVSRYSGLSSGINCKAGSMQAGATQNTEMNISEMQPGATLNKDMFVHDSNETVTPGTCALVLHSKQAAEGLHNLAVVPLGQKPGTIHSKRRVRRPFSVAEVEALVQAVEKLGTGRWRDVKLHAFGQAKHRTYVDLKDKWKTLVHTASIAPHQRRGEPVPQELLDRVIRAHSYWTAQQAKVADC